MWWWWARLSPPLRKISGACMQSTPDTHTHSSLSLSNVCLTKHLRSGTLSEKCSVMVDLYRKCTRALNVQNLYMLTDCSEFLRWDRRGAGGGRGY
jgi:hypothetical protein